MTAVLEGGEHEVFDPVPTRTDSSDALVDQIVAQIGEHRGENARAVAVGLPSIIEFATGRVRHSVNLPLADLPLRTLLSERCGLPVYVENDASCAALAEASAGGRLVCENLVMFTIGTGVGGGLVLNGKLYRGATSAAELGHTLDRPRPRRRRARRSRQLPAARLARDAGVRPRARPARAGVGARPPEVVPRAAAREGRRDHRPRRRRGRARGRRALPARDPRARRAARDRHRERDQHVRSRRGRDRRRRLAGRRPAARPRRADRAPPHGSGRRAARRRCGSPATARRPACSVPRPSRCRSGRSQRAKAAA